MIPETFLHFVWKILLFDFKNLFTSDGKRVEILKNGTHNHNQGPDFLHATVRIGETVWNGNIEMHVQSADWYAHQHEKDEKYNSVILHVVYASGGKPIYRQDGSICPEIIIGDKISALAYERYAVLEGEKTGIPCRSLIGSVSDFHRFAWIERLGMMRMEEKFGKMCAENKDKIDWEQIAWEQLMRYMGGNLNGDAFALLAREIPFSVVKKYTHLPFQLASLLFGFVWDSMGENVMDEGEEEIQKYWQEYLYLKQKHNLLTSIGISFSYFRMRPVGFPDIRLAQTVQLLHHYPDLVTLFQRTDFTDFFQQTIGVSDYWLTHYRAGIVAKQVTKNIGKDQKQSLIINAFVPFSYGYRAFHGIEDAETLQENTLTALPPEKNTLLDSFAALDIHAANALQSQGIIHLKKQYCDAKRCLECGIGAKILKG